jgi:hypothetical protein
MRILDSIRRTIVGAAILGSVIQFVPAKNSAPLIGGVLCPATCSMPGTAYCYPPGLCGDFPYDACVGGEGGFCSHVITNPCLSSCPSQPPVCHCAVL